MAIRFALLEIYFPSVQFKWRTDKN